MPELEDFMTLPQAAEHLGKNESTLRSAIKAGHLKATRFGKRSYLIKRSDLEAWNQNHEAHKRGPKSKKLGA